MMNDDMPWVDLTPEEVQELRNNKQELTEYGKEKIRELMNKTVTQQMTEYFDYNIDKAIEEYKENFPNPDKLSYGDWKELNYDRWKNICKSFNDVETFLKSRYLMYLKK
jgi:hypothetical protein